MVNTLDDCFSRNSLALTTVFSFIKHHNSLIKIALKYLL